MTLEEIVRLALNEDLGSGDISSISTIASDKKTTAIIHSKATGVISGVNVVQEVYRQIDNRLVVDCKLVNGTSVTSGTAIFEIHGSSRSILAGERVALNFLQRMSGIATRTFKLQSMINDYQAQVTDTRKTTPLLRLLEKQAVRDGGGKNHRFGLFDAVMIKDNHIKAAGSITHAVLLARSYIPHTMKIEVEVEDLTQLQEALLVKPDIIMFDNMNIETMRQAVKMVNGTVITEASGGVSEDNIEQIASTGVDYISLGSLTHSVNSLDISLDLEGRK